MSVVIPARDAAATIAKTVAAVVAQQLDEPFEVVVVDDGSNDETGRAAREAGARVVRQETATGPAEARNAGVRAAGGELLAFTDADCVPAPGWLAAGVRALEHADLVQGRVAPEQGVERSPFDHVITVDAETGLYETANLLVRREWFERVGGFRAFVDPSFGHFGEDLVFGWAVRRAGGRTAFAGDALVHHEVVARPPSAWIRERLRLRLFPAATREAPELRQRYFLGVFLSPRTAKFDLAVAAVALALLRRRPLLLLLTLPYALGAFERYGRLERWIVKRNLALLAGDAAGLAALLAGSARYRRLVL